MSVFLAANKIDKPDRKISLEIGQEFAEASKTETFLDKKEDKQNDINLDVTYGEVSSKTGEGVAQIFDSLTDSIVRKIKNGEISDSIKSGSGESGVYLKEGGSRFQETADGHQVPENG